MLRGAKLKNFMQCCYASHDLPSSCPLHLVSHVITVTSKSLEFEGESKSSQNRVWTTSGVILVGKFSHSNFTFETDKVRLEIVMVWFLDKQVHVLCMFAIMGKVSKEIWIKVRECTSPETFKNKPGNCFKTLV